MTIQGSVISLYVALALACGAATARADVLVDGDEAAVRIVARQASVAEIFAALQSRFRFRYRLAVSPEREVNGTITGPLHGVVARLLDGYDFVVKRAPDGVEVVQRGAARHCELDAGCAAGRDRVADAVRAGDAAGPSNPE